MPKDTTKNIVSNEIGMCIFISFSFWVMLILSHFLPHLWKKQCPDNVKSVEVGGRLILLITKYISWIVIQNEIQCLHIYLYSFRDPLNHFFKIYFNSLISLATDSIQTPTHARMKYNSYWPIGVLDASSYYISFRTRPSKLLVTFN